MTQSSRAINRHIRHGVRTNKITRYERKPFIARRNTPCSFISDCCQYATVSHVSLRTAF